MTRVALVIGPDASELRRRLGSQAWVVLELAVSGSCDGLARMSARSIAADLGVSKDTAARAMRRLANAGLVERLACHGEDGRFTPGWYRLLVAPDVLSVVVAQPAAVTASPPSREQVQLSLLELG